MTFRILIATLLVGLTGRASDTNGVMWCLPDGDRAPEGDRAAQLKRNARRRDIFIRFFVTCLKRLKSEFPEIKVGGPALCFVDDDYVRPLFAACKAAGVPPDARVTARVHDETHDCAPADFTFADGRLTLRKSSRESAAFLVTFEPENGMYQSGQASALVCTKTDRCPLWY